MDDVAEAVQLVRLRQFALGAADGVHDAEAEARILVDGYVHHTLFSLRGLPKELQQTFALPLDRQVGVV